MEGFKYVRLYSTPDGESHFEDVEIPYPDARGMSAAMPLAAWSVRTNGPDYNLDFHHAPRRQYIVNLSGVVEIEASDGEKRHFGPGSIMLCEDTFGKGHKTKAVSEEERVRSGCSCRKTLVSSFRQCPLARSDHQECLSPNSSEASRPVFAAGSLRLKQEKL